VAARAECALCGGEIAGERVVADRVVNGFDLNGRKRRMSFHTGCWSEVETAVRALRESLKGADGGV
jgi:hypothetical protein